MKDYSGKTPALKMRAKPYEDCRVGASAKPVVSNCAHCGAQAAMRSGTDIDGHDLPTDWLEVHCTKCPATMRLSDWTGNWAVDEKVMFLTACWNRRTA